MQLGHMIAVMTLIAPGERGRLAEFKANNYSGFLVQATSRRYAGAAIA
jgi:hypothetical protein